MSLLAQLTVTALWLPLAMTPPVAVEPSPMAPTAVAPAAAPTVVAPPGTTVVSDGPATTIVTPGPIESVSTTTTSTTNATAVTTTVVTAPPAPVPTVSPKQAVRTLLRYDPYLAPRYRSGRNMLIGGGVMLGVGTFTLLTTLSWARHSRLELNDASTPEERRELADDRNRALLTAQVVGVVAAAVAVTGVVLLATGAVRKRRAIEEARGRVFMQAGPTGMQVRF